MSDVAAASQAANAIPWATVIPWMLAAVGGTATVLSGAFTAIWVAYKNSQKELVESHKARALSAETRAIAAEQAKHEAERCYANLKGEFKQATRALRKAVRVEEEREYGVAMSTPPPKEDEPTLVYVHNARKSSEEVEKREQEWREQQRSVGHQTHLRLPPPSEALALEAFGRNPLPNKNKLPRDAGKQDHRAWKASQSQEGIVTPEQPVVPHRTRQRSHRDDE